MIIVRDVPSTFNTAYFIHYRHFPQMQFIGSCPKSRAMDASVSGLLLLSGKHLAQASSRRPTCVVEDSQRSQGSPPIRSRILRQRAHFREFLVHTCSHPFPWSRSTHVVHSSSVGSWPIDGESVQHETGRSRLALDCHRNSGKKGSPATSDPERR